jgi:hypothetical protein
MTKEGVSDGLQAPRTRPGSAHAALAKHLGAC